MIRYDRQYRYRYRNSDQWPARRQPTRQHRRDRANFTQPDPPGTDLAIIGHRRFRCVLVARGRARCEPRLSVLHSLNSGSGNLDYMIADDTGWLSVEPLGTSQARRGTTSKSIRFLLISQAWLLEHIKGQS
jgi:hypothetical protein